MSWLCHIAVQASKCLSLILYSSVSPMHAQLCPTLPIPLDCSPPGSAVHGLSRQDYWSGLPFPQGIFSTLGRTHVSCVSCLAGKLFTTEPPGKHSIRTDYSFKKLTCQGRRRIASALWGLYRVERRSLPILLLTTLS